MLGIPETTGQTARIFDRAASKITESLLREDDAGHHRISLDLYFAEHTISRICDEVFAKVFDVIGQRWKCVDTEIYQEQRGCMIFVLVLNKLQTLLYTPDSDTPYTIGGTPEGDPYNLGTTMAKIVLKEAE